MVIVIVGTPVNMKLGNLFSYLWFFDVSFCSKTRGGNSWLTPQKKTSSFQLVVFFKFMHGFGNTFLQGGPLLLVDGNLWPLFKWPEKMGNWCYIPYQWSDFHPTCKKKVPGSTFLEKLEYPSISPYPVGHQTLECHWPLGEDMCSLGIPTIAPIKPQLEARETAR